MDKYKVQITQEALADMEQLYNYIVVTLLAPENAYTGRYMKVFTLYNVIFLVILALVAWKIL